MDSPTVFISYSHDSPEHAGRVLDFADKLIEDGIDCILDQHAPHPSEGWPSWMDTHIRDSDFVIMVCTEPYYLRIIGEEVPGRGQGIRWEGNLIYQHIFNTDTRNSKFIPVLFDSGTVEHIPMPLRGSTHYRVHNQETYDVLYRRLTDQQFAVKPDLGILRKLPARERKQDFFAQAVDVDKIRVSLARMPVTGEHLFGRDKELAALDDVWADPNTNVISLIAWGGVGKSALVNRWLDNMSADGFRGAEQVYAWSFYSQGTSETAVSADLFIDDALRRFGDADPTAGSPWDKGERLAGLVRQQKTLLVLDGMEPLQNPPGPDEGRLKDPALAALVRELSISNDGLCLITTRLRVADIAQRTETNAPVIELENLSEEAGTQLLRELGVEGPETELREASREFGGHGLALNLLGTYLHDAFDGDIRRHNEIGLLEGDEERGGHAKRVMASYEHWFGEGPELAVLRLMGLFDRPADADALAVLRASPAIAGLTGSLVGLDDRRWRLVLSKLRRAKLLAEPDSQKPNTLDAHPLVREHFGERLREGKPEAWKEAHGRLYEHLRDNTEEFPDTVEEMAPLYAAVAHGCHTGRHQEAFDDVYLRRIQRGEEFFATKQLGGYWCWPCSPVRLLRTALEPASRPP